MADTTHPADTTHVGELSRSAFLKFTTQALLAASGVLGLGAVLRLLSYPSAPPPVTEFDLGPASNYPPGSRSRLPEIPALLVHEEAGFSALSLVCTHLGCTLEETAQGFACPCHGSRFDPQGRPESGPAKKALATWRVEENAAGHLILHTE